MSLVDLGDDIIRIIIEKIYEDSETWFSLMQASKKIHSICIEKRPNLCVDFSEKFIESTNYSSTTSITKSLISRSGKKVLNLEEIVYLEVDDYKMESEPIELSRLYFRPDRFICCNEFVHLYDGDYDKLNPKYSIKEFDNEVRVLLDEKVVFIVKKQQKLVKEISARIVDKIIDEKTIKFLEMIK